ncbi:DNA-directed RNA polymerase subunit beta [Sporosarcina sp. P16b]|uniref:DNA-directed RNA polymerase subunit beta n=1 Tax=Sporosarcina sp. P16b TaxID=2048261 RepID=UPI001E42FE28|nr:DNA-directed RNA polymerase subunit beta [Sporosarcina sp. P16b]
MTDKNFKKITEPLSPVKPFEPLKTPEPTEMEDPIELTEIDPVVTSGTDEVAITLAEPPTIDEELPEDIQSVTEAEVLEEAPDASEEVVEQTPLVETEPVEKLPASEQTDATFWTKITSKWPRKERSKKATKPISEMRWVQVRMIPIWLRLLLILLLIVLAALAGTMVGFSVIGDGSAGDVFKKETWQHIFDIMNGK